MSSSCGSCGAAIVWATTQATGTRIPLNATPIVGGNIELKDGIAWYLAKSSLPSGLPLYVSHFATCPNAKKHRKSSAAMIEDAARRRTRNP